MDAYVFGQVIGTAFGTRVYEGRKRDRLEAVAIKRVAVDKRCVASVAAEVKALLKLAADTDEAGAMSATTTNVLRYHAYYETANAIYVVLELCGGGSLQNLLLQHGVLGPRATCRIGRGLANALVHCARRFVVHGDLHPKNVLLKIDGDVRLCGFDGGAAAASGADDASRPPTRPAPEQLRGDPATSEPTAATDVWGLGLILYECVSGYPPFEESLRAVDAGTLRDTHELLVYEALNFDVLKTRDDLEPEDRVVAKELRTVIRTATEREPFKRAAAVDVRDALARLAAYG